MILLLDIGNTRIKWGCLIAGEFQSGGAQLRGEGDVASMVAAVQARHYCPLRVVVSNVADDAYREQLCSVVSDTWGCQVEVAATQAAAFGVVNGYDEPHRLGVDRWLALIAARQLCDGALCLVDCGTALTVDLLTGEGVHLGGMIVPGVSLLQATLVKNTEGLHVISGWQADSEVCFMARNTVDAMSAGACYSSVALIDRAFADAQQSLGEGVSLVLTGGDASMLRPHLQCEGVFEPDLVLKGVAMIAGAANQ